MSFLRRQESLFRSGIPASAGMTKKEKRVIGNANDVLRKNIFKPKPGGLPIFPKEIACAAEV